MTSPTVQYRFILTNGEEITVDNPIYYPDPATISQAFEPYIRASIMIPERYMGAVMELCLERRGTNSQFNYPSTGRIEIQFDLPLAEVIYDFYDKLKTVTQGYGSFDYDLLDYRKATSSNWIILLNGEKVDALCQIVFKDGARARALNACNRLKEEIPRHMFKIAIQGGHRRYGHCAVNGQRLSKGCYGQVLRGGYYPEKKTP